MSAEFDTAMRWTVRRVLVWPASRDDVTGEPYAGWLLEAQAVELIGELFSEPAPPQHGALFSDRMGNTLALVTGRGDGDPTLPTLIR